jgi:hypothetical protein
MNSLEKLEKMKEKLKVDEIMGDSEALRIENVNVDIEEVVRKIVKEELEIIQERIYKGLSKIIFSGRDEVKELDAKLNKLLKLAEVDSNKEQMLEYMSKLNELMR